MIRSEIVKLLVVDNPDLSHGVIAEALSVFLDEIETRLAAGGRVELRGFGAFSTRSRVSRIGRNPRTGKSVDVAPKRVPHFKPGKDLRERLAASYKPALGSRGD